MLIIFFIFSRGKNYVIARFDLRWLTLIHGVRILVELVFISLFTHGFIPKVMTFEGKNPDILIGISAPVLFLFRNRRYYRTLLLVWNCIGIISLINIATIASLTLYALLIAIAFIGATKPL